MRIDELAEEVARKKASQRQKASKQSNKIENRSPKDKTSKETPNDKIVENDTVLGADYVYATTMDNIKKMVKYDDTFEGIDGANTYLLTYGNYKPKQLMKLPIDEMPCLIFGTLVMILYKPPQCITGMKMERTSFSMVYTNDTFYFNYPFGYYHMRQVDVTGKRYSKARESDIERTMTPVNRVLQTIKDKRQSQIEKGIISESTESSESSEEEDSYS